MVDFVDFIVGLPGAVLSEIVDFFSPFGRIKSAISIKLSVNQRNKQLPAFL